MATTKRWQRRPEKPLPLLDAIDPPPREQPKRPEVRSLGAELRKRLADQVSHDGATECRTENN